MVSRWVAVVVALLNVLPSAVFGQEATKVTLHNYVPEGATWAGPPIFSASTTIAAVGTNTAADETTYVQEVVVSYAAQPYPTKYSDFRDATTTWTLISEPTTATCQCGFLSDDPMSSSLTLVLLITLPAPSHRHICRRRVEDLSIRACGLKSWLLRGRLRAIVLCPREWNRGLRVHGAVGHRGELGRGPEADDLYGNCGPFLYPNSET
ncbi:uncharacterized protein SCHCODRAFT_02498942 [Schizophyllum commune H4-8]|uniref:Expressed protein n=1 Tax=Schizophyllum commune (strain H4-8 / FGSC 9210) TaxID=578458 RepID=D8PRZ2_SCHCM|nr:uncharacterized protein SCHCODRAFT_02498942 [Schizophyllum commune H4-8]KAI5893886.1 hypothetical protein SCHCODRAFT_02498942 [Schizophyllum commune H4-8]